MDIEKITSVVDDLSNMSDDKLLKLFSLLDRKVKQDSYDIFVDYNNVDTQLITRLDNKLNFIQVAITIAHVSKSNTNSIMGTVQPWDNMAYDYLRKNDIVIPPNKTAEKVKYIGGYVKEVVAGRRKFVVSVDLASLYPSIIMMLNMSPETLKMTCKKDVEDVIESMIDMNFNTTYAKKNNLTISANGTMYCRDKIGVLPKLMSYLFDTRRVIKKEVSALIKDVESKKANGVYIDPKLEDDIARLDVLQYTYKILANSGYGAIGNNNFRYYNLNIAEGITATGQLAIRYIAKKINEYLNIKFGTDGVDYSYYSDTDSCYIELNELVVQSKLQDSDVQTIVDEIDLWVNNNLIVFIEDMYNNLSDYLNAVENRLIMEREAIADVAIHRAKKNYIINVLDMEGKRYAEPYLKMMGIETKRTSTPQLVREQLTECLLCIIREDVDMLRKNIKDYKKMFMESDINDIAYPRGVNDIEKWMGSNNQCLSGTPEHVRATITHNNYIDSNDEWGNVYEKIKSGSKIKFVKLYPNNPSGDVVFAFPEYLPKDFGLDEFVDRNKMFEGMFMSPLESFTSITNINIRHTNSFFDMNNCDGDVTIKTLKATTQTTNEKQKKKTISLF